MIPLLLPNVLILLILSVSVVLADDFKTLDGKEYKNAQVTRVEPDGIVLKTKSGISKVYFTELPKEVQERFHYDPLQAVQYTARTNEQTQQQAVTVKAQSIKIPYIEFRNATLREAVEILHEQGVENDTGGTGVNISIELNDTSPNGSPIPRVTVLLQDVTLFQAVTAVAEKIGLSVRTESNGLVIYGQTE